MSENKNKDQNVFRQDSEDSQLVNVSDASLKNKENVEDNVISDVGQLETSEEKMNKEPGFEKVSVPAASKANKPVKIKLMHLEGSRKDRIDIIELTGLPDMICTIGRDPECVLAYDPFKDQRVSSVHARIMYVPKDDEVFIEDLNSTNGTRINGIKIYEMTRLRDGDEVELGRKGVRFEVGRIRQDSEEAEIKKFQKIAKQKDADEKIAKPAKDAKGGSEKYIKEVVKQVSNESSANFRVLLISMSIAIIVLLVGLIVVIAWLINELNNDESKIQERDKNLISQIGDQNNGKDGTDNGGDVKVVKIETQYSNNLEKDYEKIKDEENKRNNPGNPRFKEVNKEAREAVYLIVSTIELQDSKGGRHLATSSGTGFVVTKDGHLVTNKHVVKPWLFEELARRIRKENMTIVPETHNVLAWKTGSEALTTNGEWKESTAYSIANQSLKIANDGLDTFTVIEDKELGEFRVHANDSNDIIMLKLSGNNFKYLELYDSVKSPDWKPEQLDSCLVIGFPEGKKTLESTKAETAPTTGEIRKIEDTIAISAPVLKGNSGGPVIVIDTTQDKSLVIGVASKVAKNTETYGICIKSQHILALLPPEYR